MRLKITRNEYDDVYLAKSDGTTILNHSKKIELLSSKLGSSNDKTLIDAIKYGSLLHDIGKLTTTFQSYIKNNIRHEDFKLKYLHNEIGWAYLVNRLSFNLDKNQKYENDELKKLVLDVVYWHHGIKNKLGEYSNFDILETIDKESIQRMDDFLISIVGVENFDSECNDHYMTNKYFQPKDNIKNFLVDNSKHMYVRSVLIAADRMSTVNNIDIDKYLDLSQTIEDINGLKFDINNNIDQSRFNKQKEIVDNISSDMITNIMNAPTGFGKTILGLLYGIKQGKTIMWICPENTIARSAYDSIINELENIGINLSVELLLSGEIENSNSNNVDLYGSDIIVTNIDNYLTPSINSSVLNKFYLINNATVIFDEYHILALSEDPLMALFNLMVFTRNNITKSKTLLLSATPLPIHMDWECISGGKVTYLPNKKSHFPAIHDKKYNVKTKESDKFIIPEKNTSSLVIINSIKNSQDTMQSNCDIFERLIHSKYVDERKKDNFYFLLEKYGKNIGFIKNKSNIIGNNIIQASLDVSFNNIYESVLSPLSTLQRVGRCNRYGEVDDSDIYITKIKENQSEEFTINILFDKNLKNMWFNEMKKLNNSEITLDGLYDIYNKFIFEDYEMNIINLIKKKFNKSVEKLVNIYPKKYNSKTKDYQIKKSNSNVLRSSGFQIYITVKDENNNYINPITHEIYNNDYDKTFNEKGDIRYKILKEIKNIVNDERFDFKYSKNKTLQNIREDAQYSNTPYIVPNMIYNTELGLMKK